MREGDYRACCKRLCVCVCVCVAELGVGEGVSRVQRWCRPPPLLLASPPTTFFFQSQLLEELRAQPVELEPFPIPMMLVGSAGDALFPPYSDVSGAPRRSSPNRSACPNGPPARTDRPLACVLVSVVS